MKMYLLTSYLCSMGYMNTILLEFPMSSCMSPDEAPSSTRAMVRSLTNAVNHLIEPTGPSLGVVVASAPLPLRLRYRA